MNRGRKPKPTQQKIREGNPGKRKINRNEPKPKGPLGRPPAWLDEIARAEWSRTGTALAAMGVAGDVDRTAFELYCVAYSRWRHAVEDLTKPGASPYFTTPNGHKQPHPDVTMARQWAEMVRRLAVEFGLTPASRVRGDGGEGGGEGDEDEKFLSGQQAKNPNVLRKQDGDQPAGFFQA